MLCNTCETKIFFKIDGNAAHAWEKQFVDLHQYLSHNDQNYLEMQVAVSSMMARAVYISLSDEDKRLDCCQRLIKEIRKLRNTPVTSVKEGLNRIGFLWYELPSNVPSHKNRSYRVEFPFRCVVHLQNPIETLCAQVPPFFCLLPFHAKDGDELKDHLQDIVKCVQQKLDEKLKAFIADPGTNDQFTQWYGEFHSQTGGPGPLLVYDYLHQEAQEVHDIVHEETQEVDAPEETQEVDALEETQEIDAPEETQEI